jgi:hypothetical protein
LGLEWSCERAPPSSTPSFGGAETVWLSSSSRRGRAGAGAVPNRPYIADNHILKNQLSSVINTNKISVPLIKKSVFFRFLTKLKAYLLQLNKPKWLITKGEVSHANYLFLEYNSCSRMNPGNSVTPKQVQKI